MDDAVVVGSGPNGLAAAVELARAVRPCVSSRATTRWRRHPFGGASRCPDSATTSARAVIRSGSSRRSFVASISTRTVCADPSPASVAHPLDGEPAVLLRCSLDDTARLERGRRRLPRTLRPLPARTARTARGSLGPLRIAASAAHGALRAASGSCPRPRCSGLASAACGRARCSRYVLPIRFSRSSVRSVRRSR